MQVTTKWLHCKTKVSKPYTITSLYSLECNTKMKTAYLISKFSFSHVNLIVKKEKQQHLIATFPYKILTILTSFAPWYLNWNDLCFLGGIWLVWPTKFRSILLLPNNACCYLSIIWKSLKHQCLNNVLLCMTFHDLSQTTFQSFPWTEVGLLYFWNLCVFSCCFCLASLFQVKPANKQN